MPTMHARTLSFLAAASLACASASCFSYVRPTRIDDAREDDHWLEGPRCGDFDAKGAKIRSEIVAQGTGPVIEEGMTVRVHYTVTAPNGTVLHDTHSGAPSQLIVGSTHVICGFDQAMREMHAGEERRVTVPWQLAFGDVGRQPDVLPQTDLVFLIDMYLPGDNVSQPTGGGTKPPPGGGGMGGRRR
jgi:hypothetical protein